MIWPQLYLCVALTTLATLLLELALTRLFSVVFYYHFAFLAISIALFGLGAGGVFSYVVASGQGSLLRRLGWISTLNAGLVVVMLGLVLRQRDLSAGSLALLYVVTALPFFLAGTVVSIAISETIERVDRVYFFDLVGAAAGCLLLVPLLNQFGGPNTIIAAAVLFAASASLWHNMAGSVTGRIFSVAFALALTGLIILNWRSQLLDVRYAKGQRLSDEMYVKWNSFSRIAVAKEKESGQIQIVIDADASTGIANFDFANLSERDRRDLLFQGPALPYAVRPGAKTLIIGPGGGWDVARALASGSRDVTGVEINRLIARTVMLDVFPHLSRNLYRRPDVRIVVEEGRS
ncbi:MAG: hypothetical protein ACRD96_08330, partial [Bryobacteraceae bacterium]